MSHTIQSTGRCGRQVKPSAFRCWTISVAITVSRMGPLSMAVTRRPRPTSCQVQPPGAAPRSTARCPARRMVSRSPSSSRIMKASESFIVDRLGAFDGMRSRGIPIGQVEHWPLSPAMSQAVFASVNRTCNTGSPVRLLRRQPAFSRAVLSGSVKRLQKPERCLASSVSGVSSSTLEKRCPEAFTAATMGVARSRSGSLSTRANHGSNCRAKHGRRQSVAAPKLPSGVGSKVSKTA